jgi:hypothetical protein
MDPFKFPGGALSSLSPLAHCVLFKSPGALCPLYVPWRTVSSLSPLAHIVFFTSPQERGVSQRNGVG